jgi:protocatechuate 3,4-dioxygenase beta subunit
MNKPTEPSPISQQAASNLTRRDVLTGGLGVIGLAAFAVGGGFVSKRFFPQRLVYKFPDIVAAQGIQLTPTPTCISDHHDPTGAFEEGPYYVPNTPLKSNFRLPGGTGREFALRGRVLDTRCRPIGGAVLDCWQVNEHGVYDNLTYNYRGHQFTRADGSYELLTVLPVPYTFIGLWRAAHIHVKVQGPNTRLLTTQVFFDNDPEGNARAFDFDRSLLGEVRRLPDGSAETIYNFVLRVV